MPLSTEYENTDIYWKDERRGIIKDTKHEKVADNKKLLIILCVCVPKLLVKCNLTDGNK